MARRRAITGKPLLVAVGAVMVLGCGGVIEAPPPPPGNLMAPPMYDAEICVDTIPADAVVVLSEAQGEPQNSGERCQTVRTYRSVRITVSAPGYATKELTPRVTEGENVFNVTLAETGKPPQLPLPPVGNLMPPEEPIRLEDL